jgi:signal transduction histidine kinase
VTFDSAMARLLPGGVARLRVDEQRRLRKFVALVLVIFAASLPSAVLQVLQGGLLSALHTTVVMVDAIAALWLVRRGLSLAVVSSGFLLIGQVLTAVMAVRAGQDGLVGLFWMSTVPLFAMAIGGKRAGSVALVGTVVIIALSLVAIGQVWLEPALMPELQLGLKGLSLVGACVTLFFLVRAYELETERSIAALEAQNVALAQARAEADAASRAKSEFLALISHEIRTPLNGVTGMATALRDERDPARVQEGLRIVQQSADALHAVINDVLDWSKVEAGRLELERVVFSPREQLGLVVDLMQSLAAERRTDLELSISHEVPPWLWGDPTRFRQVAMNLVSNAVKFTEQGQIRCRLGTAGAQLELSIQDTGIGMDDAAKARLFQPFTQADASTTRRFGGTGLGLAICQRLVTAMGGTITVDTAKGQGSTFRVRVPLDAATPRQESPVPARAARQRHQPARRAAAARGPRPPGHARRRRPAGGRGVREERLRPRADGLSHAGARWLRGHPRAARQGLLGAHHRAHGRGDTRRRGAVPRLGDGRGADEADAPRAPGGGARGESGSPGRVSLRAVRREARESGGCDH